MIRKLGIGILAVAASLTAFSAHAAGDGEEGTPHYPVKPIELQRWTFSGPFGKFDQGQLQRGFQVYREACGICHSLDLVAFRHLALEDGPHFSEEEVKALAAEYQIVDGPDDLGDMFERPGRPYDYFPAPFENPQAAAAANGGAAPPDLSIMAKARAAGRGIQWFPVDLLTAYQEAGPDYIYALLSGYEDAPADYEVTEGTYYNPYFLTGTSLKMPPPLSDGLVTYADGSPETVDQYSADVSAFLMWAAEPHLAARKRLGFQVIIFLVIFSGLMYLTKQKVWSRVAH